ncbi:DUF4190 domain-containing protein [Streptomyces sp. NPDC002588]|uniref:DUF4190 domain-containing protein n=1 Tax=Streptomyces sp. NPDC002588 TaxID=3154419 RepID=UPI00332569FF
MSDHDPWPEPTSDEADATDARQDAAPEVRLDKRDRGDTVPAPQDHVPQDQAPPPTVAVPQTWAGPVVPPGPGAFASFPPPNPATAAGGPPPNPFAPPAPQHGAVPPPPISPDGPGQLPYGYPGTYPGGYGYPAPPPAPGGYYWPGVPGGDSNGMGIAGMVLGIVSAVVFCLWPLAIVAGILGVVFGAIGRGKARRGEAANPGQALAGIICGAVGTALAIGFGLLFILTP